eukprot:TRINITY_DN3474_c0_g1_i1.p1 TRINITY_DN3474_c0_g1~~TRINITY_DN3474_c0_g1_i1.p1  ORF type:complete len:248 (-),score=39.19 TRINITY_DN3474_c0_g1_i1:17-760(-)
MATVKVNRFQDVIITGHPSDVKQILTEYKMDKDSLIIKSHLKEEYESFHYLCEKNGYHLHANDIAFKKCPIPIDGEINGGLVIPVLKDEYEKKYFLLVNRTYSAFGYSFPAGLRDVADDDYKECAVREAKEETGVTCNKLDLVEYGQYTCTYTAYEEKWENTTFMYWTEISMKRKEIESLVQRFTPNNEISKIVAIDGDEIKQMDHPKIMEHHLFAIKRIMGLNKDEKPHFPYLLKYEIYNDKNDTK